MHILKGCETSELSFMWVQSTGGNKWRNDILTVGLYIRLWAEHFMQRPQGRQKFGWVLTNHLEGAARSGAPF